MSPEEARARLAALGFDPADTERLFDHFDYSEQRGNASHGYRRIEWLESLPGVDPSARPGRTIADPGFERWDGGGTLGYLALAEIVDAQLADPPERARLVVASGVFPTGALGYWTRRLALSGFVAVLTATSPRRLAHPDGGNKLTSTAPLSIAIPSSGGDPIVSDVSMGKVTYGDVLLGRADEDELVPFGGEQAHKAFALAVGLQLLVDALVSDESFGAVLLVARPESDPVAAFRALADGARLPGDR